MFENVFNPLYSIKFVIFVKFVIFAISLIIKTAAKAAPLYVNIFEIDVPGIKGNNKYL